MNRSRRRHNRAVATALAMTLVGTWSSGAWAQTGGGPPPVGASTGGAARTTTAAPPSGAAAKPAPGGSTSGGAAKPTIPTPGAKNPVTHDATAPAPGTTLPVITPAVPAPITISAGTYTNPSGGRAEIDKFVALNLQNLLNDSNTDAQAKARENLLNATLQAGAPASPEFLFAYGSSLNNAFTKQLTPQNKLTIRQRLNIAIVSAKFAYVANNITLVPTTQALLKDPAEPVVLWALKAAQPQVPQLLRMAGTGGKTPQLVLAIAPAVFANPSGPVFDEGYQALTGDDKNVADELMKLWQNRLTQYQTKVPQDPSADGKPAFKLTTAQMWKTVVNAPPIQQKVMQMVVDQLSAAQQWADQPGNEDTHAQLVALCRQCLEGLQVVGAHQKIPPLQQAAKDGLSFLNPQKFSAKDKVKDAVDPVVQQVLTAFKGVLQPPTVGPAGGGASGVAAQP
jgi:hypothetical protein